MEDARIQVFDVLIQDWLYKDNVLYVCTKGGSRLYALDPVTLTVIQKVSLNQTPRSLSCTKDEIVVIFEFADYMGLYDPVTLAQTGTIPFAGSNSTVFCGDYVYTVSNLSDSSSLRWYNRVSGKSGVVCQNDTSENYTFRHPSLAADEENGLIYLAESEQRISSKQYLYCFDAKTQKLKEKIIFPDRICFARVVLCDGAVYAGRFKLNAANLSEIIMEYPSCVPGALHFLGDGLYFANTDYVITDNGVYLNESGVQLVTFSTGIKDAMMSDSNYLLLRYSDDTIISIPPLD